jgi:hypothetical protein
MRGETVVLGAYFRVTCLLGSTVLLAGCLGGTAGGSRGSWGGIGLFPPPDTPSVLRANYAGTMMGNVGLPGLPGVTLPYAANLAIVIDYDEARQPSENRIAATADRFAISGTVSPTESVVIPNVSVPVPFLGTINTTATVSSVTATVDFNGSLTDENGTIDYKNRTLVFDNLEGTLTPENVTASVTGTVRVGNSDRPITDFRLPSQTLTGTGLSLATSPSLELNGTFSDNYRVITGSTTGTFYEDGAPIDGTFSVSAP